MGDRTHVTIEMRLIDWEWILRAEFKDDELAAEREIGADELDWYWANDCDLVMLYSAECNYANWSELEELLRKHEIEYNKEWGQGGDYGSGNEYVRRLPDGSLRSVEIYDSEESLAYFVKNLKDGTPDAIKQAVQAKYREIYPFELISL
ncbi:MAG: hypothetical protein AB9866_21540 [Syntrophobacteraceae bacterium]